MSVKCLKHTPSHGQRLWQNSKVKVGHVFNKLERTELFLKFIYAFKRPYKFFRKDSDVTGVMVNQV